MREHIRYSTEPHPVFIFAAMREVLTCAIRLCLSSRERKAAPVCSARKKDSTRMGSLPEIRISNKGGAGEEWRGVIMERRRKLPEHSSPHQAHSPTRVPGACDSQRGVCVCLCVCLCTCLCSLTQGKRVGNKRGKEKRVEEGLRKPQWPSLRAELSCVSPWWDIATVTMTQIRNWNLGRM